MFAPGVYYVGDLCYVLTRGQWEEVCKAVEQVGESKFAKTAQEFTLSNGAKVGIAATAYGDGEFFAVHGREQVALLVDSGTIGCVNIHQIKEPIFVAPFGWIVEFDKPFDIEYDEGVIRLGDLWIDTTEDVSAFEEPIPGDEF